MGVIRVFDELVLDREAVRGNVGRERSAAWAWAAEPSMVGGNHSPGVYSFLCLHHVKARYQERQTKRG